MTDKTIAKNILSQLGGNRFLAMTGAKNLVAGDNMLMFTVPSRKSNKVAITLNADSDTYKMEFYLMRGTSCKPVEQYICVYNDMLQGIFTTITGLDTHL